MINLENFRVLVTGADGFLGSVIVDYLKMLGVDVIGTTRQINSDTHVRFINIDLEDQSAIKSIEKKGPFDAVIHFAAFIPGNDERSEVIYKNLNITSNVLDIAVKTKVKNFIFASGCSVYGYQSIPCTELTLPSPPNYYAISKLACEYVTNLYTKQHQINNCILRISAPYGPHLRRKTVITRFIELAARKQIITIYGSGKRQQEFIFEDDVASAIGLVLINNASGIYNISGNRQVSMYELARLILGIFDLAPDDRINFSGIDPQENYRGRFPTQLAENTFGFSPKVDLEDGIIKTIKSWNF